MRSTPLRSRAAASRSGRPGRVSTGSRRRARGRSARRLGGVIVVVVVVARRSVVAAVAAAGVVAPEHHAGVRPVERADVAARLELVDHPGRPGVADLEPPLEQRRRSAIVLPDDLDGVGQQAVGVLVAEVVPMPVPSSSLSTIAMS